MLFSCCTSIDNYGLLVRNGYDRIILSAVDLMSMDASALTRTKNILEAGRIKCRALNSFCTPELRLCGEGYDPAAVETYGTELSRRAGALGVEFIGIGASKSRSLSAGFTRETVEAQFRESLGILCRVFKPLGITVLLEAVCSLECNFITTTDEAFNIVQALKLDNLALVFDTYHAFMMGEDDAPLRRALSAVRLVHVAQDVGGHRLYLRRDKLDEYRVYGDAMLDAGYDGEISVEAFEGDIESELGETLDIMKLLCSR